MIGSMVAFARRRWRAFVFALLALGVIILLSVSAIESPSFQDCVCDNQKYESSKALEKEKARFVIPLTINIRCGGRLIETHNAVITALASIIIALFTATLWYSTSGMLEASSEQSMDMKKSIAESAKAAIAMDKVAQHFADNVAAFKERSALQMRAYISALIGNAIYQERAKELKFEAKPIMLNSGHTPAHKVGYKAKAEILPIPLPRDFAFPLPDQTTGASVLGPQQHFIMSAVVREPEWFDESDIADIKAGRGRALYVWGIISYEDIFGDAHETRFCQIITWILGINPDGTKTEKISGYFTPEHNSAT